MGWEQRQQEIREAYERKDAQLAALTAEERFARYRSNAIADDLRACTGWERFAALDIATQCRYAR